MPTRLRAADLRAAARKADALRAELNARGEATAPLYLDIDVSIDTNVAAAFRSEDAQRTPPPEADAPLRYIGTPRGLTPAEDKLIRLMLNEMAPGLGHNNALTAYLSPNGASAAC